MRTLGWTFGALLSVGVAVAGWSSLTAPTMDTKSFTCAPSPIAIVDKKYPQGWNFNQELAAHAFAIYAAASYDTYEPRDDVSRAFRVGDNHPELKGLRSYGKTEWVHIKRHEHLSGLVYDIYHYITPDKLIVIVAYRGTDGWFDMDTIANASWITQWFNPWDQYRQARNEFVEVVAEAVKVAAGKSIAFVTTGHSLGGGLARHVAHVHPCTSAVVFNSSFVTNTLLYGNYVPRVIRLYEKGDKFEEMAATIENTETEAVYRLTLTTLDGIRFKHNMERFGVGASRMAIACLARRDCEIRDGATLAKTLYCDRYFGFRWQADPEFAARTKDDSICPKKAARSFGRESGSV